MTAILGISAYYHDSAAVLTVDGKIIAAAQEERFTRKKHDASFPKHAIQYCLSEAGVDLGQLAHVVFYDKPLLKFERLLETYLAYAPKGFRSFVMAMPIWLKEKLLLKSVLRKELRAIAENSGNDKSPEIPALLFTEHHQSHAASAFFPSPFERAAVLCLDGVGEWATTSVWQGNGNAIAPLWELHFPHSLGLLYSAFTYYCGFKVNSGEYKLMGLAPYGEPRYVDDIYHHLIDVRDDGTFKLNMSYFNFAVGLTMTSNKFHHLFGGKPRAPESELTQKEMDLARSIQQVTEEIVLKLANNVHDETGDTNLCLAGGVALNCVAIGRLVRESKFDNIWVQPAAGDAGGALGAALQAWHQYHDGQRILSKGDHMQGGYLGPSYQTQHVRECLDQLGAHYVEVPESDLDLKVAKLLDQGYVIGWFQGRMEYGPRALGNRSIIADPRKVEMQSVMNLKIKYRESFRPFAPSVLAERVDEVFEHSGASPYMSVVAPLKNSQQLDGFVEDADVKGLAKLSQPRSKLPAITHVDNTARLQTVHAQTNPRFHRLISAFEHLTGCPVVINTSFNVRGEPIVNTPNDAYRCFMNTQMDFLVLNNIIINKADQRDLDKLNAGELREFQPFELD